MALTATEVALVASIGFDLEICEFVKEFTGRRLNRATGTVAAAELIDGISFQVSDDDEAENLIDQLQPVLLPRGYRAFWSERRTPYGQRLGDEVLVLKTTDHYAIVRTRQTEGNEQGLSTKQVIAKLQSWESRCTFAIVGASDDWVALQFRTLPKDICGFAKEVYRFCPDTVEQGVGLKHEREDPAAFAAARNLCSQKAQHKQTALEREIEMGIKLLAYDIKTTKFLFLWWD